MKRQPEITPLGDSAILVSFGNMIDAQTVQSVYALADQCQSHPFQGFVECIPAYTSLTVIYDPLQVTCASATNAMIHLCSETTDQEVGTVVDTAVIPVCYGGEYGPDLGYVAEYHGLTEDEVIRLHSSAVYTVYMIGFTPGFPYLGGLPDTLATPRKDTPRASVPAGSVGIAGAQTGVYSLTTPGGWQIIGRTPESMFNPDVNPPSRLLPGQTVRFQPVTSREYEEWKGVR